jgi:hypothetical protein
MTQNAPDYIKTRYLLGRHVEILGLLSLNTEAEDFHEQLKAAFRTESHQPFISFSSSGYTGIWHKSKSRGAFKISWQPLLCQEAKDKRRVFFALEPGQGCEVGVYVDNTLSMEDVYNTIFMASALPEHVALLRKYASLLGDEKALHACTSDFLNLVDADNSEDLPFWRLFGTEPLTFDQAMNNMFMKESAGVRKQIKKRDPELAKTIKKASKTVRKRPIADGPVLFDELNNAMHSNKYQHDAFDDEFPDNSIAEGFTEEDSGSLS